MCPRFPSSLSKARGSVAQEGATERGTEERSAVGRAATKAVTGAARVAVKEDIDRGRRGEHRGGGA